jgi:hypothetical protein
MLLTKEYNNPIIIVIPCACSGKIWVRLDPKIRIYPKHDIGDYYYHCVGLYPFQPLQIRMGGYKSCEVA